MTDRTPNGDDAFRTTQWSLVERAAGAAAGATLRGEALSELLRRYLPAMRSHLVRRQRIAPDRAEDLLQEFIVKKILEYDLLSRADKSRGKFRTLLLTSLDNFVRTELARRSDASAQVHDSLRDDSGQPASEPASELGSDFDIPWAHALLAQAIDRMRDECAQQNRPDIWGLFDARILGPTLHDRPPVQYAQLVRQFDLKSPEQASNVLITAKRMFERTLRNLIAEYAADESEIEDELNDLRAVLGRAQG